MILQLDPPLEVKTPKGDAIALFLIDYGIEHDLVWVCVINETCECWCINNPEIRFHHNWTMGRR